MQTETTSSPSKLGLILERWNSYQSVLDLCNALTSGSRTLLTVTGLAGSSEAFLIKAVAEKINAPILIVTENSDQASDLYDDLTFLMGERAVGHFPARQILPYDFRAPVGEIMGRRISTLADLNDTRTVVAASVLVHHQACRAPVRAAAARAYAVVGKPDAVAPYLRSVPDWFTVIGPV